MAIKPEDLFDVGRVAVGDANYPLGSAINDSAEGAGDGTYPLAQIYNDMWGFFQLLLDKAGITASGTPDTVLASQYWEALAESGIIPGTAIGGSDPITIKSPGTEPAVTKSTFALGGFASTAAAGLAYRLVSTCNARGLNFPGGPGVAPGLSVNNLRPAEFVYGPTSWSSDGAYFMKSTVQLVLTGIPVAARVHAVDLKFKNNFLTDYDQVVPASCQFDRSGTWLTINAISGISAFSAEVPDPTEPQLLTIWYDASHVD